MRRFLNQTIKLFHCLSVIGVKETKKLNCRPCLWKIQWKASDSPKGQSEYSRLNISIWSNLDKLSGFKPRVCTEKFQTLDVETKSLTDYCLSLKSFNECMPCLNIYNNKSEISLNWPQMFVCFFLFVDWWLGPASAQQRCTPPPILIQCNEDSCRLAKCHFLHTSEKFYPKKCAIFYNTKLANKQLKQQNPIISTQNISNTLKTIIIIKVP